MKEIISFEQWLDVSASEPRLLLFVKTDHCSVCEGLYPQVAELEKEYPFPFYKVNAAQVPEMAGQLVFIYSTCRSFVSTREGNGQICQICSDGTVEISNG